MSKKVDECRHIIASGERCQSPALRGANFCYFHSQLYRMKRDARLPDAPLILPDLDDKSAVQLALSQIAGAIAVGKLAPPQAAVLLRAVRQAAENLDRRVLMASLYAVDVVCDSGDGEQIAAPTQPCAGKS